MLQMQGGEEFFQSVDNCKIAKFDPKSIFNKSKFLKFFTKYYFGLCN